MKYALLFLVLAGGIVFSQTGKNEMPPPAPPAPTITPLPTVIYQEPPYFQVTLTVPNAPPIPGELLYVGYFPFVKR